MLCCTPEGHSNYWRIFKLHGKFKSNGVFSRPKDAFLSWQTSLLFIVVDLEGRGSAINWESLSSFDIGSTGFCWNIFYCWLIMILNVDLCFICLSNPQYIIKLSLTFLIPIWLLKCPILDFLLINKYTKKT